MKVSIITVTYNSSSTINETIASSQNQYYKQKEIIIIDGNSSDDTIKKVGKFENVDVCISEPDNGIYDALNKGIKLAKGDIIGILHSDDLFFNDKVLLTIVDLFQQSEADMVYGDLIYVQRKDHNKVQRYWKAGTYNEQKLLNGWMPPHTTVFVKREVYEKYGLYRLDLGSAADYEWILRVLLKYKIKAHYVPQILVKMRVGGVSNRSLKNRLKANKFDRLAWKVNDLTPRAYTTILKPIRKLPQFWMRPKITNSIT